MSVFRNILEKRKAALQAELDRAKEQAWKVASASLTDEQRARGLGVLLAKVNQRVAAVADTGSAVVTLSEEDEARVAALTALITRLKDKGLDGLLDAPPAPAAASPVRPAESRVEMPPRSLDCFPEPPAVPFEPVPPGTGESEDWVFQKPIPSKPVPHSGLPPSEPEVAESSGRVTHLDWFPRPKRAPGPPDLEPPKEPLPPKEEKAQAAPTARPKGDSNRCSAR